MLRRALIEYGIEYKCVCGNSGEWLGEKLTLQVHHKNNDWLDDRVENLCFMCPNCHAIESKKVKKASKKVYYCTCGNRVSRKGFSCKSCVAKTRRGNFGHVAE